AMPLRDFVHRLGRVITLDDLANLRNRLVDRLARRERAAEAPVARLVVGAGQHEVAKAGEAHERLALCAERDAEAHELGEAAGDQEDPAVRAVAEAVRATGRDREHVLDRTADLDANDVGLGVGAEAAGRNALRERSGEIPSGDATAIAVGRPWPTSFANVGPESTAIGTPGPSTSLATWCGSLPLDSSKPLLAQATRAP